MQLLEDRVSHMEEIIMKILYMQQETQIELKELQLLHKKAEERLDRFEASVEKMIAEIKADTQNLKKEMAEFKTNIEKTITEMKADTERFKTNMEKTVAEMKEDTEWFKINIEKIIVEMKADTERFKTNMEKTIAEMKEDTERLKTNMEKIVAEMKADTEKFKTNMEKTVAEMKIDFNKKWGELSNKLGTIVEDIIFPASKPVLEKYFKCEITDIHMNRKRKKDNLKDEFDVIAVSDPCKTVYLIEVKATPKIDYINEFKDEKLERFKALFPEYEDYKLIPIFASLRLEDDIINYLTKNKIYAMAYREWEYMDILNFDQIK
ncbi:hypothetical protein [Sulfurihydrogenibium azorense]|uniref:hypothetical protein n=1 Tax=Sulfurihydrogenibium azorense TaxID=309806 RepID=UPI00391B4EF6